jgi:hypothetical protein
MAVSAARRQNAAMASPVTQRLRHFHVIVLRPLWAWISLIVFGLVGGLITFRDELLPADTAKNLRILAMLPHWAWGWWVMCLGIVVLLVVFEGSFRAHRDVKKEVADLLEKLTLVGQERPITFSGPVLPQIEKQDDGSYIIKRLGAKLKNAGTKVMRCQILHLSYDFGIGEMDLLNGSAGNILLQGAEEAFYAVQSSPGIHINAFPFNTKIKIILEYDNIPEVSKRTHETIMNFVFLSFEPFLDDNTIIFRDER